MPDQRASVRLDRQDRRQIQIVAAAGASHILIPRRAVARANVKQIEFRIVSQRIPNRAAAAQLPPFARPGFGGFVHRGFHRRRNRFFRIAGHGMKAPRQLAGCRVIRRNVTAHSVFAAAVSDDDFAFDDARRAGNGVLLGLVNGHDFPRGFARCGVQRCQSSIQRADINFPFVNGYAAINCVAAGACAVTVRDLRIPLPKLFARPSVQRENDAPTAGRVHHAIHNDRRGFQSAICVCVERPGQTQVFDGCIVDLLDRAEARFGIIAPVRHPIARTCADILQRNVVNLVCGIADRFICFWRSRFFLRFDARHRCKTADQ